MSKERASLFGLGVDTVGMEEAVCRAMELVGGKGGYVVTLNPEMCMRALDDEKFAGTVRGAALVVPDGIGTVWALGRLGFKDVPKGPGIELAEAVAARCAANGTGVYLLGAKPGVAERAAAYLVLKYKGLKVIGVKDGYYAKGDERRTAQEVANSGPGVVFVAMGAGRQESFMELACSLRDGIAMIGIGGSFDVFAGDVRRAPDMVRKLGMEWLYRGLSQPSRLKRLARLPAFALTVLMRPDLARNGRNR